MNNTQQVVNEIMVSRFGKRFVNKLGKKGLRVTDVIWLPSDEGCFANGESGYMITDKDDAGRIVRYAELVALTK